MKSAALLLMIAVLGAGCTYRSRHGTGFDQPGYEPYPKWGVYLPAGPVSSSPEVAAVQISLALATAAMSNMKPGVGLKPGPHVPGRTGAQDAPIEPGKRPHPNGYLPSPK